MSVGLTITEVGHGVSSSTWRTWRADSTNRVVGDMWGLKICCKEISQLLLAGRGRIGCARLGHGPWPGCLNVSWLACCHNWGCHATSSPVQN